MALCYEISREIFKQRIENPMNFHFVDIAARPAQFEKTTTNSLPYDGNFGQRFKEKYPNAHSNILLFSFDQNSTACHEAAQVLKDLGYQFVYFYRGKEGDTILEKGLN